MMKSSLFLFLISLFISFSSLSFSSISHSISLNNKNDGAFCNNKLFQYFPLNPPNKYLPWIWDSILLSKYIEIIIISRNACKYNIKQWKELFNLYPEYKNELGNGLNSNIIVKIDNEFDYINSNFFNKNKGSSLINSTLQCVYLNKYDEIIYQSISYRIKGSFYSDISSTQIRCPLPPIKYQYKWNQIRLDRYIFHEKNLINVLSTESFSVCGNNNNKRQNQNQNQQQNQHQHQQHQRQEQSSLYFYDKPKKKYNITICTATSLSPPNNTSQSQSQYNSTSKISSIIEWIEYHLLIGIEHFYIYDTSNYHLSSQKHHFRGEGDDKVDWNEFPLKSPLQIALVDYIEKDLVTIISWPYLHCVKNMASGRWVGYYTYTNKSNNKSNNTSNSTSSPSFRPIHSNIQSNLHFFSPPRAIAHTAALSSCYSRFRHTTNWMLHIDDDEYLVFLMILLSFLFLF